MNHRYTQFIEPIDRYVERLTPRGKRVVNLLEGSLLLLLLSSMLFYVQ